MMLFASALLSQETAEIALLGMATGALYAVVALGVVVVHRASGVLNFSASGVGAVGAFVFYDLRNHINAGFAMVISLALAVVIGMATAGMLRSLRGASLVTK